jgi:hypothetical protein
MPNELIIQIPQFEVFFDNELPITARQVAKLLDTLGKDYARYAPGRELVLVAAEQGSLKLVFKAALATGTMALAGMASINTVSDFGKNVTAIIKRAEAGAPGLYGGKRGPGMRSAEVILDTTVASNAKLRLASDAGDGKPATFEMDAISATSIQQRAHRPSPKRLTRQEVDLLSDQVPEPAVSSRALRLELERGQLGAIRLLVEAFAEKDPEAIEAIAGELEREGDVSSASILRRELRRALMRRKALF